MPEEHPPGRAEDPAENRPGQNALRNEAEALYQALFENMLEGVTFGRMLYDEAGEPEDFLHLAFNQSFERVTGLPGVVGRRLTEVIPRVKDDYPEVVAAFARVAAGGSPERIEVRFETTGKWFQVAVVGAGESRLIVILEDITERKRTRQGLESEQRRLEALLDAIPLGMLVVEGPDGVISYVNRRAQEAYGFQNIGLTLEENTQVVRPRSAEGQPRTLDSLPSSRALRGESVENEEMILERPDGTTYQVLVSASPLPAAKGLGPAAVEAFADISELKRAEEALRKSEERLQVELARTRTLLETAQALAEWTDLRSVLKALTEAVVRATAHTRATFALWDQEAGEVETVASAGQEPIPQFKAPLSQFSPTFQEVAQTRKTGQVDYDELPPERRKMADLVHSRNALLVPLVYHRNLVGGLFVDDPGVHAEFTEAQIRLIEGIAAQAAVAIENARLYEAQLNIATTLQEALLQLPEEVQGLRFAPLYRSATEEASVGGDFYDLITLRDGGCVLLIGDVAGHGIEAARSATFVRDAVAAFASEGRGPEEILADANQAVIRRGVAFFVSALVATISADRRTLEFCSAGHPNVVMRRAAGTTHLLREQNAPPLGIFPDWSCSVGRTEGLLPGDLLVFYTDGVTEARSGDELWGEDRLVDWLQNERAMALPDLPSALLAEILSFTGGTLRDDVAILAVEIRGDD